MSGRNRSNPLALAVLICLAERPMHPYEVATMLRQRQKHESVRLNYGSLYAVVASLEKRGLITPQETRRSGRLPERTVYWITDAGRIEVHDWLTDLLSTPGQGLHQFRSGSVVPARPAAGRRRRPLAGAGRPPRVRPGRVAGVSRADREEAFSTAVLGGRRVPHGLAGGRAGLRPPSGPGDRERDARRDRLVEKGTCGGDEPVPSPLPLTVRMVTGGMVTGGMVTGGIEDEAHEP